MDAIYEERGSDWSNQVSAVVTTRWLQRDQTLPLSAKGVACKTRCHPPQIHITGISRLSTFMQLKSELHSSLHFGATTTQISSGHVYQLQRYAPINVMPHHPPTGQMMGIIYLTDYFEDESLYFFEGI